MTVHCEGDCRIIEQLREKQDFEATLSRVGLRHEHLTLRVGRATHKVSAWGSQDYWVTVTNVMTGYPHGK